MLPHSRRLSGLVLALLLACPALCSHAAGAEGRWYRVVTPHFTYFSASHPQDVTRNALELESMAATLGHYGLGAPVGCRPRTVLIGFPDRKSFDPHRPLADGHPVKIAGYCVHSEFGAWIGYLETEELGRRIARHEFAHTVVSDAFWHVPLCLNEGMAEFLSTFQVQDDQATFGHPLDWACYVVQSRDLLSLDELFGLRSESLRTLSPDAMGLFYAESWALVHYLARDGFAALVEFVQTVANGTEPKSAFARAFPGESWASTPGRLKSYVDVDVQRYHRIPSASLAVPAAGDLDLHEASPGEVSAHTGLWRLRSDVEPAGTAECFDLALSQAPDLGLALAGRGIWDLRQERHDEAEKSLRQAATGSPDALTLFIAGYGLLRLARDSVRAGGREMAQEAYSLLKRSVAMDSTDATALAWYARAGAESGDYSDDVIRALERASEALPSNPVLASDLASILARVGAARRSGQAREGPAPPDTTRRK